MKVLWLSHFLPYPPTGHGSLQRGHHLLRQAAGSCEVDLLSLAPSEQEAGQLLAEARAELGSIVSSLSLFPMAPDPHGLRRAAAAGWSAIGPRSFWHRWFWSPAMARAITDRVRTGRYDLVHMETVLLARYAPLLGSLPLVLSHHNIESHLLRRRAEAHRYRAGKIFFGREADKVARWERELSPRAEVNVVVSDLDGARLRELVPSARTATVSNGVDVHFFRPPDAVAPVPRSIVFVGGMNWHPNRDAMDYFVRDVWPTLTREEPARRFTVIGRSPPPALTTAAAADPRIRVLGFVDDVRPHLAAAAAAICPMRVGGGTRLKILDALALHRPLVSTDVGVEGLGLEAERHFLRANTPGEFAAQLRRLDESPELGARLAAAGRAFVVERYAWDRLGQDLLHAFAIARGEATAGGGPSAADDVARRRRLDETASAREHR